LSRPTRPMTDDEVRMARALGACRFAPATFDKRFARDIAARAEKPEPTITEAGAACLRAKVHRYRRQIPADVVALAGPPAPAEPREAPPAPAGIDAADALMRVFGLERVTPWMGPPWP
jgi:hypothetical protein